MKHIKLMLIVATIIALLVIGCERKVTNEVTRIIPAETASFVGSDACKSCHSETYARFRKTGHPYKLNEADSVQTPGYFPDFVTQLQIPQDLTWSQIDKIIGGFWWKTRYIDDVNGAIYIGPDRQYNLIEGFEGFVAYEGGTPGFVAYDCGTCHTTGYVPKGNQEGKDSLIGTWAFNGIQCEACHGPGELHIEDPFKISMVIDRSSDLCGQCHIRGAVNKIPASGGFIRHHEQWNEMFTTKHAVLECVDCHDPHIGLHPNNPERSSAIRITCENCHFREAESFYNTDIEDHLGFYGPECIDCHMPLAAKSAVAQSTYVGDIHSHLWRINTSADAEMFTQDGGYANGYLTLEFTCLKCHEDESKAWAAENAERVHAEPPGHFTAMDSDKPTLPGSRLR